MKAVPELVLDTRSQLGEGPIWHAARQALYWVNIEEHLVHIYDPATGVNRSIDVGQQVGTVVPRASGGLMLALYDGFASLDPVTEKLEFIADPESDQPDNRFNDGKCDPAGRFWAGTLSLKGAVDAGGLYCLDAGLRVTRKLGGITCSNGIVWTSDHKTMYYIDTRAHCVWGFDYDVETGDIGHRRTVVTIPDGDGAPDGMAIDAEDMIWVGHWGGWRVTRFNPATGAVLRVIDVPAAQVTACAFGGPRLQDLYITTARIGRSESSLKDQPNAGGLFMLPVDVPGVPAAEFAG
jgi:sugar lactone lactonase YvrE